ncbi:MAG: methyltransferase [Sphingobacteriia bacterium]|nr:methyltransferase [Sphingobacteriia bacterium]
MQNNLNIWARVTRGLEWVAAAEASLILGITEIKTGHRDLLFKCTDINEVYKLRCIDDAYILWDEIGGIDHTRQVLQILERTINSLRDFPLNIPNNISNLRVTASFLGKRNYSRFEIEEIIGPVIAKRFGLKFIDSRTEEASNALWCRVHLSEDSMRIGIKLTEQPLHRRYWRTEAIAGSLHPPVAAAMALLADIQESNTVIDPFCGSGTLLIEAGFRCKNTNLIGYDISDLAIKNAIEQAQKADIPVKFIKADSSDSSLPLADRIISNPPWGRAVEARGNLTTYNLITTFLGNLKPSGKAIILIDQEIDFLTLLKSEGLNPSLVEPVRIGGRLTHLVMLGNEPCFSDNKIGRALEEAKRNYNNIK